jgi:hypothetical protein
MTPRVLDYSKIREREFFVDIAFIESPNDELVPRLGQVRHDGLPLEIRRVTSDTDFAIIYEGPTAFESGLSPSIEEAIAISLHRFDGHEVEFRRRDVKFYLTFGLKVAFTPGDGRVWRVEFDGQTFERFPYDMPIDYSSDGYDIPIMRFSRAILSVTDPHPADARLPEAGSHHTRWCHIRGIEPMSMQDPQYQIAYPYWR